jgi:tight adherence protein B
LPPLLGSYVWLGWAGGALVCLALFLFTWTLISDPSNVFQRWWARYSAHIERKLYKMFIWTPGYRIAGAQLAAILIICLCKLFFPLSTTPFLFFLLLATLGPEVWLSRKVARRTKLADDQVDGFLVALANALKSRPSIGDAIASTAVVLTDPLRQELELVAKHMRVGSTVDQALLAMAGRLGSRRFDAAISSILIGRQVGGNIPEILETTAASMREMARLEGVVRTKTAEGKSQIWVLAAFPFLLIIAFSLMSPGYFDPLSQSTTGYLCALIGFGLWAASIVSTRKILKVDI